MLSEELPRNGGGNTYKATQNYSEYALIGLGIKKWNLRKPFPGCFVLKTLEHRLSWFVDNIFPQVNAFQEWLLTTKCTVIVITPVTAVEPIMMLSFGVSSFLACL